MKRVISYVFLVLTLASTLAAQQSKFDGLLRVTVNGKWGLIDKAGKVVVEPKFDAFGDFYRATEFLPVQVGPKWGYIDHTGVFKVEPKFDEALPFFGDLAAVRVGPNWGFIDLSGKINIACKF